MVVEVTFRAEQGRPLIGCGTGEHGRGNSWIGEIIAIVADLNAPDARLREEDFGHSDLPDMLEHAVTLRLQKALASLPDEPDTATSDKLRRDVYEFVDISKQKGAPIERVVIALKELAAEAGVRTSTNVVRLRAQLDVRDRLLLDVIRWAVERYFDYQRPPTPNLGGANPRRLASNDGGQQFLPFWSWLSAS